jgi:hypothetical protein
MEKPKGGRCITDCSIVEENEVSLFRLKKLVPVVHEQSRRQKRRAFATPFMSDCIELSSDEEDEPQEQLSSKENEVIIFIHSRQQNAC